MKLVMIDGNYADEFNVQGWGIVSDLKAKIIEIMSREGHLPTEIYFGTNEGIEGEELNFRIKDISDAEELVLTKFFGSEYGLITPRWIDYEVEVFLFKNKYDEYFYLLDEGYDEEEAMKVAEDIFHNVIKGKIGFNFVNEDLVARGEKLTFVKKIPINTTIESDIDIIYNAFWLENY